MSVPQNDKNTAIEGADPYLQLLQYLVNMISCYFGCKIEGQLELHLLHDPIAADSKQWRESGSSGGTG